MQVHILFLRQKNLSFFFISLSLEGLHLCTHIIVIGDYYSASYVCSLGATTKLAIASATNRRENYDAHGRGNRRDRKEINSWSRMPRTPAVGHAAYVNVTVSRCSSSQENRTNLIRD